MTLPDRKYIDKPFWAIFIALILVAILALFSAGSTLAYAEDSALGPIAKHICFIIGGVIVAYVVQLFPSWAVRMLGYVLLGISILCLYLMIIPGSPFVVRINDASRWFNLFGFQFQPSELAKLSLIIVVADLMTRAKTEAGITRAFWWTFALTAVTCLPIMMGNLSTAILLGGVIFIMWWLAHVKWQYLVTLIVSLILFAVMGYFIVEFCYVRPQKPMHGPFSRAVTWVGRIDDKITDVQTDAKDFKITDDNYQSSHAKIAIARGGKSPFGVLPGNSHERDFLPLAYADYIFAIIVEETGVIGAILLCILYLCILFRACWASSRYADYSAMLMVMGLALMLTCQALVSMAVAVDLGVVTGQPLPLISKGGTGVLITSAYFGVMMSVAREQNELKARAQLAQDEKLQNIPTITLN